VSAKFGSQSAGQAPLAGPFNSGEAVGLASVSTVCRKTEVGVSGLSSLFRLTRQRKITNISLHRMPGHGRDFQICDFLFGWNDSICRSTETAPVSENVRAKITVHKITKRL